MVKKIVLGTLLFGLIGILVVGAVIRTLDKTGNVAEARGEGRGWSAGENGSLLAVEQGRGPGQGGGAYGRSDGSGALAVGERAVEALSVYEGTVVQAPAAGIDLVLETESGEEIVVGTGPGYLADQGLVLGAGDPVRVQGFWEDGEFKAAQVTRLRDGLTITLRDQVGRPAWSGSGQRALAGQAAAAQGNGGGGAGLGQGNLSGDQAGVGQAQVDEWLTLEGVASDVNGLTLVVTAGDGQEVVLDGRAWRYLLEQGFQIATGDRVRLVGFYENGRFEAGEIVNLGTGQDVLVRDENGRPLWAGRGRGGS